MDIFLHFGCFQWKNWWNSDNYGFHFLVILTSRKVEFSGKPTILKSKMGTFIKNWEIELPIFEIQALNFEPNIKGSELNKSLFKLWTIKQYFKLKVLTLCHLIPTKTRISDFRSVSKFGNSGINPGNYATTKIFVPESRRRHPRNNKNWSENIYTENRTLCFVLLPKI